MNLYLTADVVGKPDHGAGSVTHNEAKALAELGPCEVWDRSFIERQGVERNNEPWGWDNQASCSRDFFVNPPKLVHFYAGTFSRTVDVLRRNGCKVSYTAAAHDVAASRKAHEELGVPYNYSHLTDPKLWERYVRGYLEADLLICPSRHSAEVMRGFGAKNKIVVIPHGVEIPGEDKLRPLPKTFTVGYLGNCSAPDKGLRYLLEAWGKLNYPDAVLKIAGHDSCSPYVQGLVQRFGGGNVHLAGWQSDLAEFYGSLSLYVQPSVTEGFGIEVLEAMAHGRAVLCSSGAGAADCMQTQVDVFPACSTDKLAEAIDSCRRSGIWLVRAGEQNRERVKEFSWDKVRERYKQAWKELLP